MAELPAPKAPRSTTGLFTFPPAVMAPGAEIIPPETSTFAQADPRGTIHHLLYLFWCWRGRFVAAFGTVALLGIVSLFILPIHYTANALVMVGESEPDPLVVSQNAAREPRNRDLEMESEIELIGSSASLQRVAQQLKLAERPEYKRAASAAKPSAVIRLRDWLFGRGEPDAPNTDPADLIVSDLKQRLKVERIGHSAIVRISFTAGDPKFAADLVNAVAENAAAADQFLNGLTLTERVGFDLLKAWVVSPAVAPRQPSAPNFRLLILVTVVLGLAGLQPFCCTIFARRRRS